MVSNKPFALELRLWLHQHSRSSQSDADTAASSSATAAAASPSAAAPSASTASASASDRTLLLFPLAVKISARSIKKKTNVYQSLERVWVRAQREEDQDEDESSVSSAQPAEKVASSKESAARHPRLAHHINAVQNADQQAADGDDDEDSSGGGSEDAEHSSDRSSLQPYIRSAKAQTATAAASATSPLSLPFLWSVPMSTLKSPLTNKAPNAKAAHRKGPLFKPLYLKKGTLNKAAREEQRDRSIGTAAIKIRHPIEVKAKGADLSAADLISQLHVSYAPLQQREGDAGLLVHVLTKGGASEKRPKQKYILFQAGFAYSIELLALPPSFTLTLHSFRLRSWEQQLAALEVQTEEAVLPSFPSPSKKRSRQAAASPAVRSNFKSEADKDSDGEDDEWLTDGEQPRVERKLPSRAAAPRPTVMATAAGTPSSASAIAGTDKRNKPQGLLSNLPTHLGWSLSALLASIEQDEKRDAGAKKPSAAPLSAPAPAPRRRHLQWPSAVARTSAGADDGYETDVSSVSHHSDREAVKAQGDVTSDSDLDSEWSTDDMQPTAKRQKSQPDTDTEPPSEFLPPPLRLSLRQWCTHCMPLRVCCAQPGAWPLTRCVCDCCAAYVSQAILWPGQCSDGKPKCALCGIRLQSNHATDWWREYLVHQSCRQVIRRWPSVPPVVPAPVPIHRGTAHDVDAQRPGPHPHLSSGSHTDSRRDHCQPPFPSAVHQPDELMAAGSLHSLASAVTVAAAAATPAPRSLSATALELQPTRSKSTAAAVKDPDGLPLALISSDESVASDGEQSGEEDNLPPSPPHSQLTASTLQASAAAAVAAPFPPAHVFYCASPNSRFDL